jgi:hypothetical protein
VNLVGLFLALALLLWERTMRGSAAERRVAAAERNEVPTGSLAGAAPASQQEALERMGIHGSSVEGV